MNILSLFVITASGHLAGVRGTKSGHHATHTICRLSQLGEHSGYQLAEERRIASGFNHSKGMDFGRGSRSPR